MKKEGTCWEGKRGSVGVGRGREGEKIAKMYSVHV